MSQTIGPKEQQLRKMREEKAAEREQRQDAMRESEAPHRATRKRGRGRERPRRPK